MRLDELLGFGPKRQFNHPPREAPTSFLSYIFLQLHLICGLMLSTFSSSVASCVEGWVREGPVALMRKSGLGKTCAPNSSLSHHVAFQGKFHSQKKLACKIPTTKSLYIHMAIRWIGTGFIMMIKVSK